MRPAWVNRDFKNKRNLRLMTQNKPLILQSSLLIIPALERQRLDQFKASLDYIARPYLKVGSEAGREWKGNLEPLIYY